jgi:hypothetical protein
MKTATCWKCCGSKKINAFSHIAGGDCFTCHGTGVIRVREAVVSEADRVAMEKVAAENEVKRNWLRTATRESIARLTETQLFKARDFAAACVACAEYEFESILRVIHSRIEATCN